MTMRAAGRGTGFRQFQSVAATQQPSQPARSFSLRKMIVQMVLLACVVPFVLQWRFTANAPDLSQSSILSDFPDFKILSMSSGNSNDELDETIMIIGGADFVGVQVVETQLERGSTVIWIVKKYQSEEQAANVQSVLSKEYPMLNYHRVSKPADAVLLKALFQKHKPKRVCYLGALDAYYTNGEVLGPPSQAEPLIESIKRVFEFSVLYGVKSMVLVSESGVKPSNEAKLATSTKDIEFMACMDHDLDKLNVRILRLSTVYGPRGPSRAEPQRLIGMINGAELVPNDEPDLHMDLLYVSDASQAVTKALETPIGGCAVFNVASGVVTSWPELVGKAEEATRKKANLQTPLASSSTVKPQAIDVSNTQRILGFQPTTSLSTGLEQAAKMFTSTPKTKKICFIASVFGNKVEEMDVIPNTDLAPASISNNATYFAFLLFSNLKDLQVPGWDTIVLDNLPYDDHRIQSRYPKFMSWKLDAVQNQCKAVFYADGGWLPFREAPVYERYTEKALANSAGLIQMTHTRTKGPLDELDRIIQFRKDSGAQVRKEKMWLRSQPDFSPYLKMYCNMVFGYVPQNSKYQELSAYFWDRYSKRMGTWRDQPLWCYSIHHFNITPANLGDWPRDIRNEYKSPNQSWKMLGEVGFNGHKYVAPTPK